MTWETSHKEGSSQETEAPLLLITRGRLSPTQCNSDSGGAMMHVVHILSIIIWKAPRSLEIDMNETYWKIDRKSYDSSFISITRYLTSKIYFGSWFQSMQSMAGHSGMVEEAGGAQQVNLWQPGSRDKASAQAREIPAAAHCPQSPVTAHSAVNFSSCIVLPQSNYLSKAPSLNIQEFEGTFYI